MGRVAVYVSLGLALLLSGCSSGGEKSNAPTTTATPTCTQEQANAIAIDINVALDEYMPFNVESDYLLGGLMQLSGRGAQLPSSPDEFVEFFDERDRRLALFDSVVEEWGHCLNNLDASGSSLDSLKAFQAVYSDEIEAEKALASLVRECSLETFDITGCIESLLATPEWERFEEIFWSGQAEKQAALDEGAHSEGPDIDAMVEQARADGFFDDFDISESELRCATTIVTDLGEYDQSELRTAFGSNEPLRPIFRKLFEALGQCADLRKAIAPMASEVGIPVDLAACLLNQISEETLIDAFVALSLEANLDELEANLDQDYPALTEFEREIEAIPPTACVEDSGEVEDWEEVEEGIRSQVVEILMERGATREEAEITAGQIMAEGVEASVVEDQISLWEDWMSNYPSHPVLGNHWTEIEAECVIIAMVRDRGVYETDKQIKGAAEGGMAEEDAEFLVRPVADCVDLKGTVLADMVGDGVEDPDCLLEDVTEDQITTWFVALLTDGRDGFGKLLRADLNQAC